MANKAQVVGPTQLEATETTYKALGDLTVPGGVSKIVGIMAAAIAQTATAGDGGVGVVRLTSENIAQLNPYVFPCAMLHGPAGTLADSGLFAKVPIIPCDIPVDEKDVITVEMKCTIAQGGTCDGIVGFIFE